MKKILMALALLITSPLVAAEGSKNYAGVQYGMATYSESGFPDFNPSVLILRAGHKISKTFAVEGRFGLGMSSGSNTISGFTIDVDVDSFFSAFAVGSVPVNSNVEIYGLVGITSGKLTATASNGNSVSATNSGLSYGVGINIGTTEKVSWNAEYVSYINKTDGSITSLSLGANFAF